MADARERLADKAGKEGQGRPATKDIGKETERINDRPLDQQERAEHQAQAPYRQGTDLETSPVTVNQGEAQPEDPDLRKRRARREDGEGENAKRKGES